MNLNKNNITGMVIIVTMILLFPLKTFAEHIVNQSANVIHTQYQRDFYLNIDDFEKVLPKPSILTLGELPPITNYAQIDRKVADYYLRYFDFVSNDKGMTWVGVLDEDGGFSLNTALLVPCGDNFVIYVEEQENMWGLKGLYWYEASKDILYRVPGISPIVNPDYNTCSDGKNIYIPVYVDDDVNRIMTLKISENGMRWQILSQVIQLADLDDVSSIREYDVIFLSPKLINNRLVSDVLCMPLGDEESNLGSRKGIVISDEKGENLYFVLEIFRAMSDITFLPDGQGWLLLDTIILLKTDDWGSNWITLSEYLPDKLLSETPVGGKYLRASDKYLYLFGDGSVFKLKHGGENWEYCLIGDALKIFPDWNAILMYYIYFDKTLLLE